MRLGSNKRTECTTCHVPSIRSPRRACPDCNIKVCAECRRKRICCNTPRDEWPWIVEHRKKIQQAERDVMLAIIEAADLMRSRFDVGEGLDGPDDTMRRSYDIARSRLSETGVAFWDEHTARAQVRARAHTDATGRTR